MPANTVRIAASFSFKGELYALATMVDLDAYRSQSGGAPDFHHLLAQAGDIDPYSYQYEVLETHEIVFSEATGLAAAYAAAEHFDWPGFVAACAAQQREALLAAIAARELGVDNLTAEPRLKAALTAAYAAGKTNRHD